MKITLLGTGTPAPSLERASSGYLIEVGDDVLVMDHGPGAHHRLLESGRQTTEVTHVFFSHLHYDHCLDYPRLVLQRWDMGGGALPDLQVFGPPPIARMTTLLFGEDGVFDPDIEARTKHPGSIWVYEQRGGTPPRPRPHPHVAEVHAGDTIQGTHWTVTVGGASHVQPFLECLAFRLDCDDGSICYAGDSGGVFPDVVRLAQGCDLLIHMNYYRTGEEPFPEFRQLCGNHLDNAKIASDAGVARLVLTHMLPQIDNPESRRQILAEIGDIYDGEVIWGEDLMEIELTGR